MGHAALNCYILTHDAPAALCCDVPCCAVLHAVACSCRTLSFMKSGAAQVSCSRVAARILYACSGAVTAFLSRTALLLFSTKQ